MRQSVRKRYLTLYEDGLMHIHCIRAAMNRGVACYRCMMLATQAIIRHEAVNQQQLHNSQNGSNMMRPLEQGQ